MVEDGAGIDINDRRGQPREEMSAPVDGTPTGNRTRIKGLGNLRSIHLSMGARKSGCKVTTFSVNNIKKTDSLF